VVKEYTIASRQAVDGVSVPVSPVVVVDPSSNPHRLVPQGWWLYQARRINTSGGAGALVVRISVPTGTVAKLVSLGVCGPASAGAALNVNLYDEDSAVSPSMCRLVSIAAGANLFAYLPNPGTAATATNNLTASSELLIGPGQILNIAASTSLVTETLSVSVCLLLSTTNLPVWDITGSVGGSALADSTISEANTLQKVDLPW